MLTDTPWRPPSGRHLHMVDVDAAHAATAIDEEDEFSVNVAQVRPDGLEVRTEIEHDHRVVEDVLMEASADDVDLENNHRPGCSAPQGSSNKNLNWGVNASTDQIQSKTQHINITDAGSSRRHVASLWSVSIETHFYGQVLSASICWSRAPHHVGNMKGCTKHETVSHKCRKLQRACKPKYKLLQL